MQQAQVAQEQAMRSAKQAMKMAQSKLAMADAGDAEDAAETFSLAAGLDDGFNFAINTPGRAATQPLIIRSGDLDSGALTNIQEDLSVMSRILNKAVEREVGREGHEAMGIVLAALPGSRRPQSIYLEGYGALFLVNVKFPLVAPTTKEDEQPEKQSDTTWEETKRELYGKKPGNVRVWEVPVGDAAEYNADQVDRLKSELIETLKNASNIRDVKPSESITIAVIGGRGALAMQHVKRFSKNNNGNYRKAEAYAVADAGRKSARESTMTLRVKKSDVDAFAKGDIDLDQFKKRVSVSAY
jgi:hypothetical protein